MRILHIPTDVTAALPLRQGAAVTTEPAVTAEPPVRQPAVTAEHFERIVSALHEKIRQLEERLHTLEQTPKVMPASVPAPAPVRPPISPVTVDAEAFKKNLLNKMWKYLQDDERPSKTV